MLVCVIFVLIVFFLLGFIYGLEMVQVLVLLLLFFVVFYVVELCLCCCLFGLVEVVEIGVVLVNDVVVVVVKLMWCQWFVINIGFILVVVVMVWCGVIWIVMYFFGF